MRDLILRDPFELFSGFNMRPADLMRTDVHETPDATVYQIEIPGYKKEEINVSIDGDHLIVSAKTSSKKDEKTEHKVVYSERNSSCSRVFNLPPRTKAEDVSAKYEDGILNVTVKKAELPDKEANKIAIE